MPLQLQGNNGVTWEVDTKHRAGRNSLRPLDVGSLGAYRVAMLSGSIAATLAALSPLFSLRWSDATRKLVLHDLQVGIVVDGTITTSVPMELEAILARSFTASDTGGTAISVAGNNQKMETGFGSSLVGDLRMATTAALGAGTRTLDGQPIGAAFAVSGTTAPVQALPLTSIYRPIAGVEHPVVLTQNEGLIIRNGVTGPATGTFRVLVMASWSEVASYGNAGL